MGYIGMYGSMGFGFLADLDINRVSIFAILDINEGYGFCTQVFN